MNTIPMPGCPTYSGPRHEAVPDAGDSLSRLIFMTVIAKSRVYGPGVVGTKRLGHRRFNSVSVFGVALRDARRTVLRVRP